MSSRGQAIQQTELKLQMNSSSWPHFVNGSYETRRSPVEVRIEVPVQPSVNDSTKHADGLINGTQPRAPLLSQGVEAGATKHVLPVHRKHKRKKESVPDDAPDWEIWKQPCAPQHQANTMEEVMQKKEHTHRIIFSPHYDDAVLSLGGMLSVEPANTTVITVFAGKPPNRIATSYDMICNFSDSHKALDARSAENRRSLEYLGVRFHDMDLIDYQYAEASRTVYNIWRPSNSWLKGNRTSRVIKISDYFAEIRRNRQADLRQKLAADIKKIVRPYQLNGTHVEVYSSLGKAASDHPDHEILNLAIMDLALSMRNNSSVTWLFYEDFPYVLKLADKNESIAAMSRVSELKPNFSAAKNVPMQVNLPVLLKERDKEKKETMGERFDDEAHSIESKNESAGARLQESQNETLSLALSWKRNSDILHAKLQKAFQDTNSWAAGVVFTPKVHSYDECHYKRKKSAMHMYRSQVGVLSYHRVLCA